MLNEKTRIGISLSTLVILIVSAGTLVFNLSAMKADIDISISSLENNDVRIEEKFDEVIIDLKDSDFRLGSEQLTNRQLLSENQTDLAEIKTDLKWIRAYMERE